MARIQAPATPQQITQHLWAARAAQARVGDLKGIGTPAMPLGLAVACLVTGILSAYRA